MQDLASRATVAFGRNDRKTTKLFFVTRHPCYRNTTANNRLRHYVKKQISTIFQS